MVKYNKCNNFIFIRKRDLKESGPRDKTVRIRSMITILHVDDSPADLELIRDKILSLKKDIDIDWATSAREALRKLKEKEYDCILCDFKMSEMNGFDLLRSLRNQHISTPFIFLTSQGSEEIAAEALRSGADDYFTKEAGFAHYDRLINSIQRVVEAHGQQRIHKLAVQALKESEKKYRSLTENINVGIYRSTADPQGKFIEANPAIIAMFGYESREEFLGISVSDLYWDPKHREDFQKEIKINGYVKDKELLLKRKNNSTFVASVSAVAIKGKKGEVKFYDGIIEDITERKQAEESLKESEERYRDLVERSRDGVALIVDSRIQYVNPALARMSGYGIDELTGQEFTRFLPAEEIPRIVEIYNKRMSDKEAPQSYEVEIIRKNGSRFPAEVNSGKTAYKGKPAALVMVRDITEWKRAECAMRESSDRFRAVADSSHDWEYWINAAREFEYISPSCERITGYRAKDFFTDGSLLRKIIHPDDRDTVHEHLEKELKEKEDGYLEFRITRADGELRWIGHACQPVLDEEGSLTGRRASNRDITERKQAINELNKSLAQLEQRTIEMEAVNKELEAFSYSVSHDLRAPLRHIDGYSRLLMEDFNENLDEKGREHLTLLRESSERMSQLIEDLLRLSRISRSELRVQSVNLSTIAKKINAELRRDNPSRNVEFYISGRTIVKGDRRLLHVVLENLIGNAWKFTKKKRKAEIRFGTKRIAGSRAFFVADNGVGFKKSEAGKLFAPFKRLHAESEFEGSGIGLATVQRIVHRHGGRVWAEGLKGKGATFYFTLG